MPLLLKRERIHPSAAQGVALRDYLCREAAVSASVHSAAHQTAALEALKLELEHTLLQLRALRAELLAAREAPQHAPQEPANVPRATRRRQELKRWQWQRQMPNEPDQQPREQHDRWVRGPPSDHRPGRSRQDRSAGGQRRGRDDAPRPPKRHRGMTRPFGPDRPRGGLDGPVEAGDRNCTLPPSLAARERSPRAARRRDEAVYRDDDGAGLEAAVRMLREEVQGQPGRGGGAEEEGAGASRQAGG